MHAQMQQECDEMAMTQPLLIARAPLYPYSKCNEHVIQLWPPSVQVQVCYFYCQCVVSTYKHVWHIGTCHALHMYCSWYFLLEVNSESSRSCSDLQPDWSSCSYPYVWLKDSTQWFSVDDLQVQGLCMITTYFGIHVAQPSLTSFAAHAGNQSKCCNSSPSRTLYAILPSPRRYTHGCHLIFYVDVT